MKILHVFPYLPTPKNFGGALRVYYILKHHVDHHDVTVCGFDDRGDKDLFFKTFPKLKSKSHFVSRPFKKKFRRIIQFYSLFTKHSSKYHITQSYKLQRIIDRLLEENDFDVVLTEFPTTGAYRFDTDAVTILDAHNVEYHNLKRMSNIKSSVLRKYFYRKEYQKYKKHELNVCSSMDAMFVTSRRDGNFFNSDVPEVPKFVIPNGVDTSFFSPSDQQPEPNSLVFTGAMGYVPNYEGILYFLDDIFPLILEELPDMKIYIVGMNPPKSVRERAADNIIVTGFVDDIRPFVYRSSVYVVPLQMGSGTRLKVLEALSMKKPVVTTSIGCEGIDVTDGENVLIRDDSQAFADAVIELVQNKLMRDLLSNNGYEMVKNKYAWNVIGNHIEDAYHSLFESKDSGKTISKSGVNTNDSKISK